jgi:hypothetical protein
MVLSLSEKPFIKKLRFYCNVLLNNTNVRQVYFHSEVFLFVIKAEINLKALCSFVSLVGVYD